MATSTSQETESTAPPTTAENSQAKHPRGRGGKWRDVLGQLKEPTPKLRLKDAVGELPGPLEKPKPITEKRTVMLRGVHEPEEALQRAVMALRTTGHVMVKPDRDTMMVKGRKLTVASAPGGDKPPVTVLLRKVPEGHEAIILADGYYQPPGSLQGYRAARAGVTPAAQTVANVGDAFDRLSGLVGTPDSSPPGG